MFIRLNLDIVMDQMNTSGESTYGNTWEKIVIIGLKIDARCSS